MREGAKMESEIAAHLIRSMRKVRKSRRADKKGASRRGKEEGRNRIYSHAEPESGCDSIKIFKKRNYDPSS